MKRNEIKHSLNPHQVEDVFTQLLELKAMMLKRWGSKETTWTRKVDYCIDILLKDSM